MLPNGILLVDKPSGVSSHRVVSMARAALGLKKVGHAGTLDPMATGLLVLGIGHATRLLTFLVGADKTYEATITLGAATVTDDAEGDEVASTDASMVTQTDVERAAAALTGRIQQVPSSVSAIKVDGVRSYARVRDGEAVALKAREVTVSRFELGAFVPGERPHVDAVVDCSSGTYIRALARDMGEDLGVGGHLSALRRTRVGDFSVADAVAADEIRRSDVMPAADAVRRFLPTVELDEAAAGLLRNGRRPDTEVTGLVAALHGGAVIGVARGERGKLVPVANMPAEETA